MMDIFRRLYSWISWQRIAVHEFQIKQPKIETVIVLSYAFLYIFAAWIFGQIITRKPLPLLNSADFTTDVWYVLVFKIGLLLIVPGIWFFLWGYRIRDLLPQWKFQFKSVISIVLAFVLGISLNLESFHIISEAAGRFSTDDLFVRIGMGATLPLFMAGVPEEFFYRGILQTRLERLFGRIVAISVTALLFTAWHLPTRFLLSRGVEGSAGNMGLVLISTGIPVFIVGLIFCILWDRYRSLLPLIAAHWGIDVLPAIISFLGIRY